LTTSERYLVCAVRADDEHWVALPTAETAERSAAFWQAEGWTVYVYLGAPFPP